MCGNLTKSCKSAQYFQTILSRNKPLKNKHWSFASSVCCFFPPIKIPTACMLIVKSKMLELLCHTEYSQRTTPQQVSAMHRAA